MKSSSFTACPSLYTYTHSASFTFFSTAKRVLPHADAKTASPPHSKPTPRPGTYIVKVPRDQIYRAPHPENARLFQSYTSRKSHSSLCCCCLAYIFVFVFIFPLAIAAGVLYLVFRPKPPDYTVQGIAIKGMDLTSPSSEVARISPEFDVRIRANNPNDRMGIYYANVGSVEVFYKDVMVCSGAWTAFYQPPKNVTVVETSLKGSNGVVRSIDGSSLASKLKVRVAVKLKVGSLKTWEMKGKIKCDITVDKLTEQAKIASQSCDYSMSMNIW